MDRLDAALTPETSRRRFVAGTAAMAAAPALAQSTADLHLTGRPSLRPTSSAFPGKRSMILQRIHPPLLGTSVDVFDGDVFTHNDRFFVRWHWPDIRWLG